MASVEKTYADALFSLIVEENPDKVAGKASFDVVTSELQSVQTVITGLPDFVKFLNTPTISDEEKMSMVERAFSGRISGYVYNFLRLLTSKKRMAHFSRINSAFRELYNERFDIAEITITSSMPLTSDLREKITQKVSQIIGKTLSVTEKIDSSIIGGVIVDYGNTRLDGSVKTRLGELKKDISSVIA